MKVVILCGGLGTRIRDVSADIPKPMIPIGSTPILWHIMRSYSTHGFKEFVLFLGYQSHVIKQFFLNYTLNTRDVTLRIGRKVEVARGAGRRDLEGQLRDARDVGVAPLLQLDARKAAFREAGQRLVTLRRQPARLGTQVRREVAVARQVVVARGVELAHWGAAPSGSTSSQP